MSDNEKSGGGISGIVGGVAGGALAGGAMYKRQEGKLLDQVLTGTLDKKVDAKFAERAGEVATEDLKSKYAAAKAVLKPAEGAESAAKGLEGDAAKAAKEAAKTAKEGAKKIKGEVFTAVKKGLGEGEGKTSILKGMSGGQKVKVVAAAVAGVAAGSMLLSAVFGGKGKHTAAIEAERAQSAEAAPAR
jgi:hypothetical protein